VLGDMHPLWEALGVVVVAGTVLLLLLLPRVAAHTLGKGCVLPRVMHEHTNSVVRVRIAPAVGAFDRIR